MELTGSYHFNAPAETVWGLLTDPAIIASCLAGCDQLVPVGEDCFRVELAMTVAAISGRYTGTVTMLDKQPPKSYRLLVEGAGRTGFVKGEATFEISEKAEGAEVVVKGRGEVGGLVARVGQRLLGSVSKLMMDRFFACLQQRVTTTR